LPEHRIESRDYFTSLPLPEEITERTWTAHDPFSSLPTTSAPFDMSRGRLFTIYAGFCSVAIFQRIIFTALGNCAGQMTTECVNLYIALR
jgi:hypothetical protein